MSTKPAQKTESSVWKGPLLAFAGGALAGVVILPFIPSREEPLEEAPASVSQGQPIVPLDKDDPGKMAESSSDPQPSSRGIDRNGFESVGFDTLAGFAITGQTRLPGASSGEMQTPSVPDHIKELNGQQVAVEGFMLPIRVDRERREVREMFLMKDHSLCCFGEEPEANEFIYVQLEPGSGVPVLTELAVRLYGEMEVRSNHQDILMEGLYRMRGYSVERL